MGFGFHWTRHRRPREIQKANRAKRLAPTIPRCTKHHNYLANPVGDAEVEGRLLARLREQHAAGVTVTKEDLASFPESRLAKDRLHALGGPLKEEPPQG